MYTASVQYHEKAQMAEAEAVVVPQDIRCNMAWHNSLKEDLFVELCRRKPPHIDNDIWRWMIYLQVWLCCSDKTSNLKTSSWSLGKLWWAYVTIFWYFNRQKKINWENIQQINQCNFSRFENNICSPSIILVVWQQACKACLQQL